MSLSEKSIIERNQIAKTLRFKPWSGKNLYEFDDINVIKEEIEGVDEKEDEEHNSQNEKIDTFSEVSNLAKHDEIGYFYKFQSNPVKLIKKLLD